jgi:hypothetical protein
MDKETIIGDMQAHREKGNLPTFLTKWRVYIDRQQDDLISLISLQNYGRYRDGWRERERGRYTGSQ